MTRTLGLQSEQRSDPGRQLYLQRTHTATLGSGKGLTGVEVRSTFNCTAASSNGEVKGGEFKARHTGGNAFDVGTMKGVIGNVDSKSGAKTITSAWAVEGVIDCGVSSTITTAAGLRVAYNEDGVVTNAYGVYVDGASVWNIGVYVRGDKATVALQAGADAAGGGDVYLYAPTANYRVFWDDDADTNKGTWYFGQDTYGMDVIMYGQTTAESVTWDASAGTFDIASVMSGGTADHVIDLTLTDSTATTGGDAAGLHLNVTYSGDHTGSGWKTALAIDYVITGDNTSCFATSVYTGGCGDAVIGVLAGYYVYMDDIGGSATVSQKFCLDLNNDNGDNATIAGFMRVYVHGATVDNVIYFGNSGGNQLTNFLQFAAGVEPFKSTGCTIATGDSPYLVCLVGATTYGIPMIAI